MKLEDYLHLPPFEGLVGAINTQYVFNLNANWTTITRLVPDIDDPHRLFVTLQVHRSSSESNQDPVPPPLDFHYTRFDLATYVTPTQPFVVRDRTLPLSTADLVELLSEETGYRFTYDDFLPMQWDTPTADGVYTVKAHPLSLRWVGEFQFVLDDVKASVSSKVQKTKLANAMQWAQDRRSPGPYQVMDIDFTNDRDELIWLTRGDQRLPTDKLIEILRRNSRQSWQMSLAPSVFNLTWDVVTGDTGVAYPVYNVLYNGPVRSQWTPVTDKRYVLVLGLSQELCLNLTGMVLLHYD